MIIQCRQLAQSKALLKNMDRRQTNVTSPLVTPSIGVA